MQNKRCGERGLTLIELLMVMVVIAVIMVIVLPRFGNPRLKAQEASLRSDLRLIREAINTFQADTGRFPNTLADLTKDVNNAKFGPGSGTNVSTLPGVSPGYGGPYIDPTTGIPVDPTTGVTLDTPANYPAGLGVVNSINPGTGLDGTPYRSW